MTEYEIDFSYVEPRWGRIETDANNAEDAEGEGLNAIKTFYPEALDITIDKVVEKKDV